MIKMKIVLNELKTKKLGYEITNCYQVIDDFFLKNHLNKESKHIYTGDDNSFYLFAYLFNSLMKNTWFFRIIDEFKWYLCNVNDIKCIFYDLNGTAALKEISLKLELACNDYYDDKSFYDAYMEKCGFKTPVHNFLYHSNSAIEISKCITDLFSPNDFYLREQLKATIKRVIIIFAIDNGNNLLSLAYYISDKNLILPANRQDITKYIPTHNISKLIFLPSISQLFF